jgi:Flp pilus assembly protein TadG
MNDARADGASSVAAQIKLLSRFLYLYGRITNGFDVAAESARRGETNASARQQTEQSKAAVRANLKNVREGLDDLELRFRTTPELQRYYISLAGVAAGAANAEEKAAANQFDQAGRSLVDVVTRLTNVLLEMR